MANVDWTDLNKDGRRMDAMIRKCEKWGNRYAKENNADMYFAFMDRVLKATHTKAELAEIVLNVRKVLKFAKKIEA